MFPRARWQTLRMIAANMSLIRSGLYLGVLLMVLSPFRSLAQNSLAITTNSPCMVSLGWRPSPSADVSGYYLCWGFVSGQCTNRLDAGSVTNVSLTGLIPGLTYYFTVVAYSSFGDESPPSNEVSYSAPTTLPNRPPTMDAISDLTIPENTGPLTILITGIGPGPGSENQVVTLSTSSSKPSLINPVVHVNSPSTGTATLTFAIAANAIGTSTITVVADDGQPTNNITTRTFEVTVARSNPPQTPLANVTIAPYSAFSYVLPSSPSSTNRTIYSLEPGAPDNASVAERGGVAVLTWVPTSTHASTTNLISVRASDPLEPTRTTNLLFMVTVTDYLTVRPDTIAVELGTEVSLPLYVISSEPLGELTFTVSWPSENLTRPSLSLPPDSIFTSSLLVQSSNLVITLHAAAGQSLMGSNLIANLSFTGGSNQVSAFIPIQTAILSGSKPNGVQFTGLFPGLGEVVAVGENPLLKALVATNSTRMLNLYGRVGATYQVLYSTTSFEDSAWKLLTTYTQTNAVQSLAVDSSAPTVFYRLAQ